MLYISEPSVYVNVKIILTAIIEINDELDQLQANMKISVDWNDPNVKINDSYNSLEKSKDFQDCVWVPTLWFYGQQKMEMLDIMNLPRNIFISKSNGSSGVNSIKITKNYVVNFGIMTLNQKWSLFFFIEFRFK